MDLVIVPSGMLRPTILYPLRSIFALIPPCVAQSHVQVEVVKGAAQHPHRRIVRCTTRTKPEQPEGPGSMIRPTLPLEGSTAEPTTRNRPAHSGLVTPCPAATRSARLSRAGAEARNARRSGQKGEAHSERKDAQCDNQRQSPEWGAL